MGRGSSVQKPQQQATLGPFLMLPICLDRAPCSGPMGSASWGVPSIGLTCDQAQRDTCHPLPPSTGSPEAADLFLCGVFCFLPLKNVVPICFHTAGEIHVPREEGVIDDLQPPCMHHRVHGSPRAAGAWSSSGPSQNSGPAPERYPHLCSLSVGQVSGLGATPSREAGSGTLPRPRGVRGIPPAVAPKRGRV